MLKKVIYISARIGLFYVFVNFGRNGFIKSTPVQRVGSARRIVVDSRDRKSRDRKSCDRRSRPKRVAGPRSREPVLATSLPAEPRDDYGE
jgi:hypothetical protein